MSADITITMADLEANGTCARGARRWFINNGFDFKAFLKDGIPSSSLLSTGDAMAVRTVELTRLRRG